MTKLSETCLLVSGLNVSECASWVQAWGTILAVLGAAAIALWQQNRSNAAEVKRAADALQTLGEVTRSMLTSAHDALLAATQSNLADHYQHKIAFERAAAVVNDFPIYSILQPSAVQTLLEARRLAALYNDAIRLNYPTATAGKDWEALEEKRANLEAVVKSMLSGIARL